MNEKNYLIVIIFKYLFKIRSIKVKKIIIIFIYFFCSFIFIKPSYDWGVATLQNLRFPRYRNQDRFCFESNRLRRSKSNYFFGIFDGHGGHDVSNDFAAGVYENFLNIESSDLKESLEQTFEHFSFEFIERESGSTAVVGAIKNNRLCIANVGDSRALLVNKNGSFYSTIDHKPISVTEEGNRILTCGGILNCYFKIYVPCIGFSLGNGTYINFNNISLAGDCTIKIDIENCLWQFHKQPWFLTDPQVQDFFNQTISSVYTIKDAKVYLKNWYVENPRLGCQLALSRSMGDRRFRQYGVTSDPDFYEFELNEDSSFLILASDGLWDIFTNEFVANSVSNKIKKGYSLSDICNILCNQARLYGSGDDITVLLINLFDNGDTSCCGSGCVVM
jgi:serine/threonine protein phosphatase PrpC